MSQIFIDHRKTAIPLKSRPKAQYERPVFVHVALNIFLAVCRSIHRTGIASRDGPKRRSYHCLGFSSLETFAALLGWKMRLTQPATITITADAWPPEFDSIMVPVLTERLRHRI